MIRLPGLELLDGEKASSESKLAAQHLQDVFGTSDEGVRKSLLPQGERTNPESLKDEQRRALGKSDVPCFDTPSALWSFFAESGGRWCVIPWDSM